MTSSAVSGQARVEVGDRSLPRECEGTVQFSVQDVGDGLNARLTGRREPVEVRPADTPTR